MVRNEAQTKDLVVGDGQEEGASRGGRTMSVETQDLTSGQEKTVFDQFRVREAESLHVIRRPEPRKGGGGEEENKR